MCELHSMHECKLPSIRMLLGHEMQSKQGLFFQDITPQHQWSPLILT